MSLVDSSQQWFPTSVQVTVHQARNLRAKGKHDSNDAYAIIQVAKDKFSTSVVEKSKAPIWKEEASFDLPLFHPGNVDRCTLYLVVMHRVQGGLDKFLGQAVVNLLDLHENTARHKPAWFPLVDKNGKADKLRGDVLLGISFMRINMSASMVDLSTQEKHRSRLSKLSAKLRPKKQRSLTDSNSDIMPPVDQVLTDSEGEHDSVSLQFNQTPEEKNKSKVKKFFSLNSNLKRKTFQPHAPFGTQIEKNSSRSSSRSSGINVETPEAKKKFKFPGHKRSGSSDSKVSLGALSLLSRSKRSNSDLNDVGVNGNQKYEDAKSGSSLSLNSSGQGSVENVHQHTTGAPVLSFRSESQNIMMEKLSHQEEEERRQMEARSMAEAVRLQEEEEEERRRAEALILQEELTQNEEFDRNRHFLEDEARLEQLREEEEERARLEAAEDEERLGLEEQTQRAEDQKRQEEASMSERLSSLFGMLRKKEEKKEETQQYPKEELTTQAPHDGDGSFVSSNQLEDISLSSSPQFNNSERLYDDQKPNLNPRTPSAMLFLNRTPKVSTVKPSSFSEQNIQQTEESLSRPLPQVPPGMLNSDLSTRESPLAGSKKALLPPLLRQTNQMGWDTSTPADQTNDSVTTDQKAPTARPRQMVSITEPTEQHYSSAMPDLADTLTSIDLPRFSMSERREKVTISEFDPLSKDPWAPEKPTRKSDDIYAVLSKKEQKPENRGVMADDLDQIFNEEKSDDRFSSVNSYETSTYTDYSKVEEESRSISPVFERRISKKTSTPSRSNSQRSFQSADEEQPTLSEPEQELPTRDILIDSITQSHPADGQIDGEDPFDSNPFAVTSAFPSSEDLPVIMEEPSSEIQVLSARKTRGSLPPADFISSQISKGGDLASTLHRPHPVKPMHSTESQVPINSYALKDLHVSNGTAGKVKTQTAGLADSGPFTQLTHEELITLVVRQQADLSKKESQISELEEYIDNLLVRVIEEKPAILQALKGTKPV
ncbi:uncharacterized protein rab11fip1a isoform X3 [Nerophis lumbriciformis]|uniref:uncharacterized protein rab11fip1a isoform X3 n=1 Tax=Nerophis lumbriciformis TaxID=546530 RepID=UPI002AE0365E|nr:rab11 family-interacting protein 1-like isoform X3 [Nerophis lumbriciformis]